MLSSVFILVRIDVESIFLEYFLLVILLLLLMRMLIEN